MQKKNDAFNGKHCNHFFFANVFDTSVGQNSGNGMQAVFLNLLF